MVANTASPVADNAAATPTQDLADWVASLNEKDISQSAYIWSTHTFLDWLGVTIAGAREPLSDILIADAMAEGAQGSTHLFGRAERVIPSQAALINGSASHALDYDDVHMRLHGHPSVPVLPALLALAEQLNSDGKALLTAFIAGYEVECLIGEMIGDSHYETGWHNTATIGTFGAAAACSRLLGLDAEKTAMALGIAATQAAGLKSMFGTMCKPLHAGKSAFNGLLAARLASRGFTSRTDALECAQGFADTQSNDYRPLPVRPDVSAPYAIEANLFKYHAACYLTHSPIEAVRSLRQEYDLHADDIARIRLQVGAGHLKVCNIPSPQTGLEIKFSLRHTSAMALLGADTGALATYSDENAQRPDLVALREKVVVETKQQAQRSAAEVVIELNDGRSVSKTFDVGIPATNLDDQWQRVTDKFRSIVEPVLGAEKTIRCIEHCQNLQQADDLEDLLTAASL